MKELKYLDDKQAQNIAIMLKTLKTDPNEFSRWLIECNTTKLTSVILEQLEKNLPEDKILLKYQELKENIDELDNSEKFLVVISQIKGLRKRIRNLIFKEKFNEMFAELKTDLAAGSQVCTNLKTNDKFKKLLEVLLLIGNFMNSGSSNLEATIGFDMRYLPKFYGTKANDNRRTLLHLVAQIVVDKHPMIADFYKDFDPFIDTACKSMIAMLISIINFYNIIINCFPKSIQA